MSSRSLTHHSRRGESGHKKTSLPLFFLVKGKYVLIKAHCRLNLTVNETTPQTNTENGILEGKI